MPSSQGTMTWMFAIDKAGEVARRLLFVSRLSSNPRFFPAVAHAQIAAQKETLAKLESMDNGKPLDEAMWDMVSCAPALLPAAPARDTARMKHTGRRKCLQ